MWAKIPRNGKWSERLDFPSLWDEAPSRKAGRGTSDLLVPEWELVRGCGFTLGGGGYGDAPDPVPQADGLADNLDLGARAPVRQFHLGLRRIQLHNAERVQFAAARRLSTCFPFYENELIPAGGAAQDSTQRSGTDIWPIPRCW